MPQLRMIPTSEIYVPTRFRQDFGNMEEFTQSIREKGLLQPITVSPKMELLAGERRLKACKLAGLAEIPCLVREVEDAVDAREIELFENIHRKDFTWVERVKLVAEIDSLRRVKDPLWSQRKTATLLDKSVGGVSEQLQLANALESIPELAECKTEDEAFKLYKKAEEGVIVEELRRRQQETMKLGHKDMLKIADANYMIEDTFGGLVDLRSEGVVHLIEVDPPYGIELPDIKRTEGANIVDDYKEIPTEEYEAFLHKLLPELYRIAGRNCWLLFWFGPSHHCKVIKAITDAGWIVDPIPAIWSKLTGQTMQPEINLARTYEPFFVARKGSPILNKRGRSNVFEYTPTPAIKKYHPTERPIELMNALMETFTFPGQIVVSPFLGSGVTLRACYLNGLKGYGWDISGDYKDKFMLAVDEDTAALDKETLDATDD